MIILPAIDLLDGQVVRLAQGKRDDVTVYSGHGPTTTIGQERRTNPFLTGAYSIGKGGKF